MAICNYMPTIIALLLMSVHPVFASSSADPTDCLIAAGLNPISSNSTSYANDSLTFNHRLLFKPVDIVFPADASGVAKAVKCASEANVSVTARSGGHSYASNSAGGKNGSLVVDLKNLTTVILNNTTAVFGTGIRLGNLALELFNGGERAMAHGKFFRVTAIH